MTKTEKTTKTIIPPEWVHILPSGRFSGQDNKGSYTVKDPQKLIDASLPSSGRPLPVDYNHFLFSEKSVGATDATVAGWIDKLETRSDGIWGHVKWTPKASQMIKDREWRYMSPAMVDKGGVVTRIIGAALVNRPNLIMTDLFSEEAPAQQEPEAESQSTLHAQTMPGDQVIFQSIQGDMNIIRDRITHHAQINISPNSSAEEQMDAEIKRNLGITR